jgi:flagellar basal body-associated protein FliL
VQVLILILIVIALVVVIGAVFAMRRKPASPSTARSAPEVDARTPVVPEPPPMSDLESALSQVTDSTGRPIKDHIDAETDHVDELRVPDDTGPLLRRALDHVAKPADDEAQTPDPDNAGDDPSSESGTRPAH